MRRIYLTSRQFTLVDDRDYEYLLQWHWYLKEGFAASNQSVNGRQRNVRLSRVIAKRAGLKITNRHVDHANGNKLNNCRRNLRVATPQQNSANQKCHCDNRSRQKGVSWNKQLKKWHVRIHVNGQRYHLGLFTDLAKAARAYNKAARKYFGKFARLNRV